MKRSGPLKRTELNRKTPLRKQSAKKRAEIKETAPLRKLWLAAIGTCEDLECNAPATGIHEIPAGKSRHLSVRDPRCWLGFCVPCHEHWQGQPFDLQFTLLCEVHRRRLNLAIGRNVL